MFYVFCCIVIRACFVFFSILVSARLFSVFIRLRILHMHYVSRHFLIFVCFCYSHFCSHLVSTNISLFSFQILTSCITSRITVLTKLIKTMLNNISIFNLTHTFLLSYSAISLTFICTFCIKKALFQSHFLKIRNENFFF